MIALQVCSGTTGHAEAVRFEYDPSKVKYEDLVSIRRPSLLPICWPGISVSTQCLLFRQAAYTPHAHVSLTSFEACTEHLRGQCLRHCVCISKGRELLCRWSTSTAFMIPPPRTGRATMLAHSTGAPSTTKMTSRRDLLHPHLLR